MSSGKKKTGFDQLFNIKKEMSMILNDFTSTQQHLQTLQHRTLDIALDVFETDEHIYIRTELPGVRKEEIQLYMLRDVLVIEGEKKLTYRDESCAYLNMELQVGRFKRDIEIGKPINVQNIKAKFENGVLQVMLEKISDRRGRRKMIDIE